MKIRAYGDLGGLSALGWLLACSGNDSVVLLPREPDVSTIIEPSGAAPPALPQPGAQGVTEPPRPVAPAERAPLYVLANEVYDADSSTSYVNVLTSLDIAAIDCDRATPRFDVNGWSFQLLEMR